MRRVFFIFAILAWAVALTGAQHHAHADVLGVRGAAKQGGSRLVVDLSHAVKFRVFALQSPARLVVDLPKGAWRAKPASLAVAGVTGLRHGQFRPDIYRLVFDLKRSSAIQSAGLLAATNTRKPRLVVDLKYDKRPPSKIYGKLRPKPAGKPKRPATPDRVIVIDAGHGGQDPGATGVGGVVEKRVNLAVARALKRRLEQRRGYKVVLTRQSDIFLRLRERVRRGRKAKADLFIALHADSHPDRHVAGASLYTLSERASDKEADRLARQANAADLIGGAPLNDGPKEVVGILIDLAQRETKNQSSAAADDLLFAMANSVPLLNRPKRAAGFAVLKAPDVPSVLIELGFLSNAEDAKRLNSKTGRAEIADAIAAGVFRYFEGANTAHTQR
jgi:N-acetylmuramoyl-L-alanine amidase